jgi:adenosylcobinamide-phosphate synthase
LNYAFELPLRWIAASVALDLVAGDPLWLPHPVRMIGWTIAEAESRLNHKPDWCALINGGLLTSAIIAISSAATWIIIASLERVSTLTGLIAAVMIASTTLALRGLEGAAHEAEYHLREVDLNEARRAIRSLVGRDPEKLDSQGVIHAAIESLAENASDGFIAPLLFLVIAGPVGAMAYKAINTLDSMIGYRDERHIYFGRVAARLDDCVNLLPSRLTAVAIVLSAFVVTGRERESWRVCRTDGGKHESPNAGYPEAAMAGALGIELGGDAWYAGELERRATFGRNERIAGVESLRQARLIVWIACGCATLILFGLRLSMARLIR